MSSARHRAWYLLTLAVAGLFGLRAFMPDLVDPMFGRGRKPAFGSAATRNVAAPDLAECSARVLSNLDGEWRLIPERCGDKPGRTMKPTKVRGASRGNG